MKKLMVFVLTCTLVATLLIAVKKRDQVWQNPNGPPISWLPDGPDKPPQREATFDEAVESINKETLQKDLAYLASEELEGRMSGKQGNVIAAKHIKAKYESFGLQTMYDRFTIKRVNPGPKNETGDDFTQNIYAWIEGNDPLLKDEVVVVGAHMDHIGYGPSMSRWGGGKIHPGADDNASGTVALMEIAEAFSLLKNQVKRTVVFQSYSAEEMGLIGARYYCDNPKFPMSGPSINKHVAMINMDMVGYLGKGQFTTAFEAGDSSIDLGRHISELNGRYSFAEGITSRGSGGSDHACFYNKQVPVAFLHTGGHPNYHTPNDTADKINYDGLERVARYAFELAWKVTQAEAKPQFNMAKFVPMEYTHDHGHPEVRFGR